MIKLSFYTSSSSSYNNIYHQQQYYHRRRRRRCHVKKIKYNSWNTLTQVQNLNGTSSNRFKISNLKKKYYRLANCNVYLCSAIGCNRSYQATAHVLINDQIKCKGSNKWWLIPTCTFHNISTHIFDCKSFTRFVSVKDIRSL